MVGALAVEDEGDVLGGGAGFGKGFLDAADGLFVDVDDEVPVVEGCDFCEGGSWLDEFACAQFEILCEDDASDGGAEGCCVDVGAQFFFVLFGDAGLEEGDLCAGLIAEASIALGICEQALAFLFIGSEFGLDAAGFELGYRGSLVDVLAFASEDFFDASGDFRDDGGALGGEEGAVAIDALELGIEAGDEDGGGECVGLEAGATAAIAEEEALCIADAAADGEQGEGTVFVGAEEAARAVSGDPLGESSSGGLFLARGGWGEEVLGGAFAEEDSHDLLVFVEQGGEGGAEHVGDLEVGEVHGVGTFSWGWG